MLHLGKAMYLFTSCQWKREMCLLWVSSGRMNTIKILIKKFKPILYVPQLFPPLQLKCWFSILNTTHSSKIVHHSQSALWRGVLSNVPSTTRSYEDKNYQFIQYTRVFFWKEPMDRTAHSPYASLLNPKSSLLLCCKWSDTAPGLGMLSSAVLNVSY